MLTVGLTGGIGSGKSTVAEVLRRCGAVVIDADAVAREVVEPGTATLAAIADRFGSRLVRGDGSLDRAALAALVFPDPPTLAALDAIMTPAIAGRVAQLRAVAPDDAVTVFDMPLLVERRLWPHEHLTVVVGADAETRVRRLVRHRGLTEADARHRIAAQATDEERRAAADVWVDNDGPRGDAEAQVRRLWIERLVPYNDNLATRTRSQAPGRDMVVDPDPTWLAQGARLVAKISDALGDSASDVQHIGSTSVPGLLAKDVVDIQVGVRRLTDADGDAFRQALLSRGFVRVEDVVQDTPHPTGADPRLWTKRFHAALDPGRPANVHLRQVGSPGWRFALQLRDWLRAEPDAMTDYAREKRRLLATSSSTPEYAAAKEPWFAQAYPRVLTWANAYGWTPSSD